MTNPRFAPEFQVMINGAPLPAAMRASIAGASYQTGLEGADRVELTLVNDNLRWLDHPLFALDNSLELAIGYAPDPLARVFVGEIVGQSATFPSSGGPTLTVVAQDLLHRLQTGTGARWFAIPIPFLANYPLPDIAVAGLVGLEHLLIPIFDPIGAALSVLVYGVQVVAALGDPTKMQFVIRKQADESDYTFLLRIARQNGWEMTIDHDGPLGGHKLHFVSSLDHLDADLTLRYGESLIDFTPRISKVGQIAGVSVKLWRPEIKTEFTVTVAWDWDRQRLDLSISPGFGLPGAAAATPAAAEAATRRQQTPDAATRAQQVRQRAERQLATPAATAAISVVDEPVTLVSAPRVIMGKLLPRLNKRLTAAGSTVGDPRILAGTVIQFEGVGEQFGGRYRVSSATHTINSNGYRTSFEASKEIWFGSVPSFQQGAVPVAIQGQRLG